MINEQKLIHNAKNVGRYLSDSIAAISKDQQVAAVRGAGLFIGVDIVTDRASNEPDGAAGLRIVNEMRPRRVLISASGPLGHEIRPPLPFSQGDADRLLAILEAVIASELH